MTSGLKTLSPIASPLRLWSKASLFHSSRQKLHLPILRSASLFYPLCTLQTSGTRALPKGVGEAVNEASEKNSFLQVVLVSPQIPGNVGSIARTCAASGVKLHLVQPLGFAIDDTKLKRAGLDYWPYVVVKVHLSWSEFLVYFSKQIGEKRLLAFTKSGTTIHSDFCYRRGDWLVFGSETKGLPPEAVLDCKNEPLGGGTVRIPMVDTYVRCLNLSVSVGVAVYEASRQIDYEQLQSLPEEPHICIDPSFFKEDIFA
ncbi:unnamed protein product [Cuscuta epithymum]|uniref:tRNA/rRNA methyltransferase SpoU type domain-containing protein n=1 Tax=Cuscuta epithymum TaxID=186058 RepID=A0AAV0EI07_9ASTE|nr:unnamed protein product [Cuscuta epithymum]